MQKGNINEFKPNPVNAELGNLAKLRSQGKGTAHKVAGWCKLTWKRTHAKTACCVS
jgi:hypothetical protein